MPLPPAVRAAVLRYLADTPGLALTAGSWTAPAGRIAVSVDSDHSACRPVHADRRPGDGRLLGTEDMLTTTAGKLGVPVPSVIGYTVFLDAAATRTRRDRDAVPVAVPPVACAAVARAARGVGNTNAHDRRRRLTGCGRTPFL
jgi:hypothetical protein